MLRLYDRNSQRLTADQRNDNTFHQNYTHARRLFHLPYVVDDVFRKTRNDPGLAKTCCIYETLTTVLRFSGVRLRAYIDRFSTSEIDVRTTKFVPFQCRSLAQQHAKRLFLCSLAAIASNFFIFYACSFA
jgi:hypothetical protein